MVQPELQPKSPPDLNAMDQATLLIVSAALFTISLWELA
jgi:hypothetical protein